MSVEARTLQTLARSPLAYLTTTGRKSGKPRTVELWFAYHEGLIYLLGHTDAHWVRNLTANPRVTVEIDDTSFAGTARFDDEQRTVAYRLFEQKYGKEQVSYWYRGESADRRTIAITPTLTGH